MTNRELEQKLAGAADRAAPDDLEAILSRCGAQNGSVITMKPKQKNKVRWLVAACAALVLVGGGGGVYYHQSYAVASVVSLDVNPSIELKVNRSERVISCTALNTEAAVVLFDMNGGADLKGTKVDVAVNAIVGALVREGYLDSISSAILISVEDNDQNRAQRLQAELVASVDGVLKTQAPGTSILSQVLDAGAPALDYSSNDSGLSAGKASLVRKVMEMNVTLSLNSTDAFDKLASLSVEELNDLLKSGEIRIPIGKPAASVAAETYAGTLALDSVTTDVDPELDEVPAHYEVELNVAGKKYEYRVDAFTGEILSGQKDVLNPVTQPDTQPDMQTPDTGTQQPNTGAQPAGNTPTGQDVGEEAAKKAALSNAGLTESQVSWTKVEREWDDGRLEYELEFWCGTTEYDCTVDGHTGSVLKCGIDHHGSSSSGHHSDSHHGSTTAADIGQDAAKAAALTHAGVSESQASKLKVKQDWDGGRLEYEVEFKAGGKDYEYTIDGATGAILEYESEWDD